MGCLAKAYCHRMHHNIPFHHYRPSNIQNPVSLFAITSPWISGTDPFPQKSNHKNAQLGGHFIIPTVAAAASAWLFLRLHQNPPIITAPPIDLQQLELEEEGAVKELPLQHKPGNVKSLHFYKTKAGTVLKLIDVYDSDDYESLKARIRLSAGWLERARRELEEVVERDPGRVMEYSQVVDELMDILRDMEVYIDKCHKDRVKGYLRSCNRLLARVRRMEAQILIVLKEFHDQDEH
ncbi:hypothetical protein EUTSA_v10008646mg [Eutrema salsugineum]|uniref:Uncharacterized protein n=1 Tax=Eutrema salsugineum TaxID=72664 RepID=V4KGC1_EUTSA|nr:uncharacterized protein LOC18994727 [Eutrema salsugineum]ESQ36830.1 hypothetical protein EUTSA_v10008646mg [Eutrema salsugineum]